MGGHEIFGRAVEVGGEVTKFKVGDLVGVGFIVDSCQDCDMCKQGDEMYCYKGFTATITCPRGAHGRVPGNQELPT